MSLGGIAIAIGAMVDAAIVVVEQTHKKLEHWQAEGRPGPAKQVIIDAVKEVGGPSFFSLLVIAVSFMPIFALQYQGGRLFKPLAFTKNFLDDDRSGFGVHSWFRRSCFCFCASANSSFARDGWLASPMPYL